METLTLQVTRQAQTTSTSTTSTSPCQQSTNNALRIDIPHTTTTPTPPTPPAAHANAKPQPRKTRQLLATHGTHAIRVRSAGTLRGVLTLPEQCATTPTTHTPALALYSSLCADDTCAQPEPSCVDATILKPCGCTRGCQLSFTRYVDADSIVQLSPQPSLPAAHYQNLTTAALRLSFVSGVGKCRFSSHAGTSTDSSLSHVCGEQWDGVWLGDAAAGCTVEEASVTIGGRAEIVSMGCALGEDAANAPYLYRRLDASSSNAHWRLAVRVTQSSETQWSGGGLLVTLDEDGSASWLALFFEQGRWLWTAAVNDGVQALNNRTAVHDTSNVWLSLRRVGSSFHAEWRLDGKSAWRALGEPLVVPSLSGPVRVGVAHQTASWNMGAVVLDHFVLERVPAAHADFGDAQLSGVALSPMDACGEADECPIYPPNLCAFAQGELGKSGVLSALCEERRSALADPALATGLLLGVACGLLGLLQRRRRKPRFQLKLTGHDSASAPLV